MEPKDKITVVTVCDNHYLILLAALIKSIEQNHHTGEDIDLVIVEDKISTSNKRRLTRSIQSSLIHIKWISMQDAVPTDLSLPSDKSTYPINIYLRIFIPLFIPADVKRVLYLDVDMIVTTDISELWNTDIQGFPMAAVQDPRIKTVNNSWGGIKNYEELGLAADTMYFNTGLLLIDTDKWRDENIAQQVIDCVQQNNKYLNYPDQYALNVVFANNWFGLDPLWNHFVTSEVTKKPKLIHFVERKPVYKSYSNSKEFQELFYHYLKQTEWKNSSQIGEFSRYIKKVKNLLNKISIK